MKCLRLLSATVLAVLFALVSPVSSAGAADVTIVLTDRVSPRDLTVAAGTTVVWRNDDGRRHRVRSEGGPDDFDGDLEPGERFSIVLTATGVYRYVDDRDRDDASYHGSIEVTSNGGAPPNGGAPANGGAETGGPSAAPAPSQASVSILDRSFRPSAIAVATNGTVTWTNNSGRQHTVTGAGFDSGIIGAGGEFRWNFGAPGTYPYVCELHDEMRGSVSVGTGGPTTGPPPPPAPPRPAPAPSAPAGASSATPATDRPGQAAANHLVEAIDQAFRPSVVAARVGDTLRVVNRGRAPHTATSNSFDTGTLRTGQEATIPLQSPGVIPFGCSFHPEMTGTVTVSAASGTSPPTSVDSGPPDGGSTPAADSPVAPPPPASGVTSAPLQAEVEVRDFEFGPPEVTVSEGGTVTWRFVGEAPHTVTATAGDFDSGVLRAGAEFEHRFAQPGTFTYACDLHPAMQGAVVVTPASSEPGGGEAKPDVAADGLATDAGSFSGRPTSSQGGLGLVGGLVGAAAIIGGTGALLFGSSRMLRAGAG